MTARCCSAGRGGGEGARHRSAAQGRAHDPQGERRDRREELVRERPLSAARLGGWALTYNKEDRCSCW